jgi:hypothetical protein
MSLSFNWSEPCQCSMKSGASRSSSDKVSVASRPAVPGQTAHFGNAGDPGHPASRCVLLLEIKIDDCRKLERALHAVLDLRGLRIVGDGRRARPSPNSPAVTM